MRRTSGASSLLVAALVLLPLTAAAQSSSLAEGMQRLEEADFDAARTAFERVLADSQTTRADWVRAHVQLAVVRFALRDRAGATEDVRAAIAAEPNVAPPAGSPPPLVALFTTQRAMQAGLSMTVHIDAERAPVANATGSIRVRAEGLIPATAIRVRCSSNHAEIATTTEAPEVSMAHLEIPALTSGASVDCVGAIVTSSGVALSESSWHGTVAAPILAPVPLAVGQPQRGPSRALIFGVAGGGVAVVAAVVVVLAVVLTQPASMHQPGDLTVGSIVGDAR